MSFSVGGINLAESAINTELRVAVLERLVERLVQLAPPGSFTQADVDRAREEAIKELQTKYPNAGIEASKK